MDAASLPEVLPKYVVLAPLYNETKVIGQLLEGLGALDFPADRLLIAVAAHLGTTRLIDNVRVSIT